MVIASNSWEGIKRFLERSNNALRAMKIELDTKVNQTMLNRG